jgi:hypothetical protein
MAEKKSWRDVYKIHPAAALFPMLPEDELRKLGEDIKKNGLSDWVALWCEGGSSHVLLDGRNRLDAMELVGMDVIDGNGKFKPGIAGEVVLTDDPYAYVISNNIRRRHLTKEQQADLIVRASAGLAKLAKPVKSRNAKGQVQGQATKDPIKEKAVEEGKKHGISKRTIERSIAKVKGPVLQRKPKFEPGTIFAKGGRPPEQEPTVPVKISAAPAAGNVQDLVKKIMAFLERNLSDKSHETLSYLSEQLTAAIQDRMRSAPRKLSRPG